MKLERAVLVIDDERNFCRVLEAKLRRSHYDVVVAFDAASALDRLLHRRFDLILLDVRLPDADGISVLAAARAAQPGVPVLVMTAYEDDDLYGRAMAAGAAEVLYKPFDLNVLIDTLHRHIEAGHAVAPGVGRQRRERRQHPRTAFTAPVRITADEPPSPSTAAVLEGLALDLSAGGIGVVTSRPLPAGASAHIAFTLQDGRIEEFDAQAIVVRAETLAGNANLAVHRLALEFTDLPGEARARLAAALSERPQN